MLETQLEHANIVEDFVEVEFSVEVGGNIECAFAREDRVLHTTTVKNHAWGVDLRQVVLEYQIDTKVVGLCSQKLQATCSRPTCPQVLTTQIPSVSQLYWRGKEKTVHVRICIPTPSNESDFNVSYTIKAIPETRDSDLVPLQPVIIESNMHVKIK